MSEDNYDKHWFVRSLKYRKPSFPRLRQYKSLPGQLSLFDDLSDAPPVKSSKVTAERERKR